MTTTTNDRTFVESGDELNEESYIRIDERNVNMEGRITSIDQQDLGITTVTGFAVDGSEGGEYLILGAEQPTIKEVAIDDSGGEAEIEWSDIELVIP